MILNTERPGPLDRFATPLYSLAETARFLDVPESTLHTWARGYRARPHGRKPVIAGPVLTTVSSKRGGPTVPFIGLAEGLTLAAFRRAGVPLQRIRPALDRLEHVFGIEHALASHQLFTNGAEVLSDYAGSAEDDAVARAVRQVVVVRNGQRVLADVVKQYLHRLEFGEDGYPRLIHLPAYEVADVVVDPERGFGQPIFARGGARLNDALALFRAGEPLEAVAEEYGAPRDQLEDAIRIATRRAA